MYCCKCGTELDDGSLFCSKCGARVVKDSNPLLSIPSTTTSQVSASQQPPTSHQIVSGRSTAPAAIGSIICGVIGLFLFGIILGIIAIATGVSARNKIKANPENFSGEGLAMVGIVLGVIDSVVFFLFQMNMY